MLTVKQIKAAMADRNLSEVARRIGMRRQQLWLIVKGISPNPTIKTLERISEYLEGSQK